MCWCSLIEHERDNFCQFCFQEQGPCLSLFHFGYTVPSCLSGASDPLRRSSTGAHSCPRPSVPVPAQTFLHGAVRLLLGALPSIFKKGDGGGLDNISYLYYIRCEMIILPQLKCLRCGWNWIPRIPDPGLCPHCKNPYWKKPKKKKESINA